MRYEHISHLLNNYQSIPNLNLKLFRHGFKVFIFFEIQTQSDLLRYNQGEEDKVEI